MILFCLVSGCVSEVFGCPVWLWNNQSVERNNIMHMHKKKINKKEEKKGSIHCLFKSETQKCMLYYFQKQPSKYSFL